MTTGRFVFANCRALAMRASALVPLVAASLFAQWTPDLQLTTSGAASTSFTNSSNVVASDDDIHAVWSDVRSGSAQVFYKRSSDRGVTWGPDIQLSNTTGDAWNPGIAMTGQVLHVVWSDTRTGNLDVFYKRSSNGGVNWSPDIQLTDDEAWSWYPAIAACDSCVYVVTLSDGLVCLRGRDSGRTWLPPMTLTDGVYDTPGPSVVATSRGAVVVWVSNRDGNQEIYCKRTIDHGATWGPDGRLSFDSHTSCDPAVAVFGEMIHVAWTDDRYGDGSEVFYRRSLDHGESWMPEVQITDAPGWSTRPSLIAAGSNVHVVWQDERTGELEICYCRSTDRGENWGREYLLTDDSAASYYPSITLADSELYVVWTDERTQGSDLFFKSNPTGNPPSATDSRELDACTLPAFLRVEPNPFVRCARVPGHESEQFDVFDPTGRLLAVCPGNRIGLGLHAGTYFVRGHSQPGAAMPLVKLE